MTATTQFEATDGGLVLTNAILLYSSQARTDLNLYAAPRSSGPAFASIHAVEQDQGQPTIAAGSPLTRAQAWHRARGRQTA